MNARGHKLTDRIDDLDRASEWFVLRTATRQEARAEEGLLDVGVSVYVPRMARLRRLRRPDRRDRVEVPLFDGYMFAGLRPGRSLRDFHVDGVSGPLRFSADRPQPVRFHTIELLALQEVSGAFDATLANIVKPLEIGEEVRLLDGPLAGFPGWVVKLKSKERVRLLVSVFGAQRNVTMKADQVERVA